MLNKIKLTNFRKHTSTEMSLGNGLVVLRGSNEAGKSTLIEGICYALFGVKALRSSLDDAVTYGEPVGSLKAELDITVDGVEYNVKRGKSGAEIVYDGGRVTGQTEVTSFLCNLMKVDPTAASRLMLAQQGEIRGALESGPKATTELIEKLAEFDQLDNLIDVMQEKLTLGNTAPLEARLADAEQMLANIGDVQEPDYNALEARIAQFKAAQVYAQSALEGLESQVNAAQGQVDTARAAQTKYEQAAANLDKARAAAAKYSNDLGAAQREANTHAVFPKNEQQLRDEIAQLDQADKYLQVYKRLEPMLEAPEVKDHDHSFSGLKEHIADLMSAGKLAESAINSAHNQAYLKRSDLTSGTCSWCGQDFSHLPEVAAKNTKLQAEIEGLELAMADATSKLGAIQKELAGLNATLIVSEPRMAALEAYPDHVVRVGSALPPTLQWIGPDVAALVDAPAALKAAKQDLQQVLNANAQEQAALARYEAMLGRQSEVDSAVAAAKTEMEISELRPSLEDAIAEREAVLQKRRPLQQEASDAQTAHQEAVFALRDAKRSYEAQLERQQTAARTVDDLRLAIKATEFNNTLLKKVRQARPAIADKLWGIVLSAVSSYFSEMRGVRSKVTKDSDGFKVDEHPVQTLSGSTLDILGLAIRVALTRTFLPTAPFMVLDEPCAAMDAQRTEATLGFVVACGYSQVILVTHEDTSETVADHMIEIGG
jgi:DNA repair exonuclease SbcCD ATPase subunit